MEFQRLCYFRLGTTGDNAGYQLAAASSEVTSAQAREFGQAVSRVSSVPEGFDAAEGTFSSGDKVYLSHVSMSSDVSGRLVPISSALVIGGAEWRQLLRQQPAWLLSLDRSVFFDTCPQGAYPGHPASVTPYPVKEDALPTLDMMALRRKFGLDDKARFKELLLCLYHCLFAPTEEKLFISLPQEKYSNDGGRELMACIYSALPAAIAAQLSYRIGLSPLPAQLTLGLSVNRHVFPNYVDLFPCEQNQGTPMVKYTPISGLSFLAELIDVTLSPEGPALLAKIDDFYAQLDPFVSGSSAFSEDAEKGAKYLLCAAWLYASGISQRGEDREYFRSGTPSEGYTFLFLCKSIKHPGKDICEPVLAKLTELYALHPLDIQADAQGLQFDRKVVDEVSEQAWAFTAAPDSPYEQAYFHLAERPERREACMHACEQRPESPRHIRLRTHLVETDETFPSWTSKHWIRHFLAGLPSSEKNEELIQACQKLSSLLRQKFYALEELRRADLITAMLENQQELSDALTKELGKDFLANQADSLCLIADDAHAFQCLRTLFHAFITDNTSLKRLFLSKDEGRFAGLSEGHRAALYTDLFTSGADIALKEKVLSDDAFVRLTEEHRVGIFNMLLRPECSAELREKLFFVRAFSSLSEDHRAALYTMLFNSEEEPLKARVLIDPAFTSLSDEALQKIYAIYLQSYPGDEAVSGLVFHNDRFNRLNPDLWKNLLDLILTNPKRGESLADSLFDANLFCRLPGQARLTLFISRITDSRTSAGSVAALLRSPARAGLDIQQQSELLSQILTRFVSDDTVVRQVFLDSCFDKQDPDARYKQYRQVLEVRRPANRLCLDLINEHHLDGLDTQHFSALIATLSEQLDAELLPYLLESPCLAQLPGESLLSSVSVLLDRALQEKQKFFSSPLYSRLSPQQKLSLLERYADEDILSVHLEADIRNALLSRELNLSPRLLQICDCRLFETPGFAEFYMDYLEKVRFNPSDVEKAKQELQTAHKNNPVLCRRFFHSVAQRNQGYGSWTALADWYISSFAMPEERNIPEMREKQSAFQRLGLSGSAEILRQRIKEQALHELKSSKDPVNELPRLEQLLAEDPDFLPPLRDAFWQRISVSDFDPDLLPFYQEHLPSSEKQLTKAEHFISMANDFVSLRQGKLPASPEALRRIAVQGKFYGKDGSVLGSLDAAARQRLSRTISDCLAALPAEELLSSPDLTVYRFCQGQPADSKTLDLLFDWVEENHLAIDAAWAEQSVLIQPVYKAFCKRCARQQKSDENGGAGKTSGKKPWLIAGIAIAAVLLIAGACLFFLLRSRNADPAEETPAPGETASAEAIDEETPSSEAPVSDAPVIEDPQETEPSVDDASAKDEASVEDEASGEADIADEQGASADADADTTADQAGSVSAEESEAASSLLP